MTRGRLEMIDGKQRDRTSKMNGNKIFPPNKLETGVRMRKEEWKIIQNIRDWQRNNTCKRNKRLSEYGFKEGS